MVRHTPESTRTDTLLPDTTLFLSDCPQRRSRPDLVARREEPPCDQRQGQVQRGEQAAAQRQRGLRLPDKAGPKTIDGIEHGIAVDPVAKSLRQARHREESTRDQPPRDQDEPLDPAAWVQDPRPEHTAETDKG